MLPGTTQISAHQPVPRSMQLSPADAEQFFRVMLPLQFFAVEQTGIAPEIATLDEFIQSEPAVKVAARDALYQNPDLFEASIDAKSKSLSAEDLKLARSWQVGHVAGNFFVERHLKKHSIWIGAGNGEEGDKVYCVLGLGQPFEDLFPKSALPRLVVGALLPFKGQIIYDGLVMCRRISFGPTYRADLRERYMAAKQNRQLIESLDDPIGVQIPTAQDLPRRDWTAEITALKSAASKLKGDKDPIIKEIFATCRRAVDLAEAGTIDSGDFRAIVSHSTKVAKALRRLQTAIDRARMQ